MSHLSVSSIQTHKSHFIFVSHALEWLPFHQDWQAFGRPEDTLKGCITFTDTNQRAYLSMKTRLDRGNSNDLCFCCESSCLLTVYKTAFLSEGKQNCCLVQGPFVSVLFLPLLFFSALQSLFLLTWRSSPCAVSLSFSMYLGICLSTYLSVSICLSLSGYLCFFPVCLSSFFFLVCQLFFTICVSFVPYHNTQ